jgi:vitamin B12 transporter
MLGISMLSVSLAQQKQDSVKVELLDEIVLTDSRFELKRENSGKVITKITQADLKKLQGQPIAEIIGRTVGVDVNGVRSNAGQNLNYFVRGGRNRQVLILIDGIQVTDPSQIANDYDLRLLNVDQVESIEILKGASSTLYGTGAATAVINIKLKKAGTSPFNLNVRSILGTNQPKNENHYRIEDFQNSIAMNGTSGKLSYLASFGHQFTDGLSAIAKGNETDAFSSQNGNLKLAYNFNSSFKVTAYGSFDRFNAEFDDSFAMTDADNVSKSKQYRLGISPEFTYGNGSITVNAAFNDVEREIESGFPSLFNSQSIVIDAFNRYNFNDKFYTVLGLNYQNNDMESFSIPFGETDFSRDINPNSANFEIIDPYANVVYVSDFGLNINAGLRLNKHSEYGSQLVYSLNPSYKKELDNGYLKALVSYSTAFITPSLYQLFEPNFGNTDLQPEENQTFEIGAEFHVKENATLSLVYFNRNEENFIDFRDTGNFVFQYQNIDKEFTATGLEFTANVTAIKNINLNANATYTNLDKDLNLRIPEIKINARIDYQLSEKTVLSIAYQFNDDRDDVFFNNETFESVRVNLEPYIITDFFVSHEIIKDKMTIFSNITNIFNEDYQELFGFTTRGRNINIGFNLNL